MEGNQPTRIYTGETKRHIGEVLKEMARQGRRVPEGERARWQENRRVYLGDLNVSVNVSSNTLQRQITSPRSYQRRPDSINRLRQFVDGRVAMLTRTKPPMAVAAEDQDQQSVDGARQAERILESRWGTGGWDVQARIAELGLTGDIDGISYLYVNWDPNVGDTIPIPTGPDGKPIGSEGDIATARGQYEALRDSDPAQQTGAWKMDYETRPQGEVVWRVVRPGALAVDPFVTREWNPRWVIETRVMPRSTVEDLAGMPLEQLLDHNKQEMRIRSQSPMRVDEVVSEDEARLDGGTQTMGSRDQCVVHTAFITPHGEWPMGAYVQWWDQAPGKPLVQVPWDDGIPYYPYIPKPDGQHLLKSRGTVDDLKPIQRRLSAIVQMAGDWLRLVARPPLVLTVGALSSESVFNDEGVVFVRPGANEPRFMQVPAEPVAMLTQHIQWLEMQMAEIAVQPAISRGQAVPNVDAAAGLNLLAQQTEQQLSGAEAQLVRVIEWGASRGLKMVGRYYRTPRLISMPGAFDSEEIVAFQGAMLRGCHRVKVTGSVLPRMRAASIQAIMQFAPILGPDIKPWIGQLIEGDLGSFMAAQDDQKRRQRSENRVMASLATNQLAQAIWQNFESDKREYEQMLAMSQVNATNEGMPSGAALMGAPPAPLVTPMLEAAGIQVPRVEDFDDDDQHMVALDSWRVTDGFAQSPPIVRQVAREHALAHKAEMGKMLAALSQQQATPEGSAAAEKGVPSPPKQPGATGGPPPMMG